MHEGIPQSDESISEAEQQKQKWIGNQLETDPSKTVEQLSKEYDEKRAEVLAEGGYDDEKEFTQMAGKEGAGTVEPGHRPSLSTEERLDQ